VLNLSKCNFEEDNPANPLYATPKIWGSHGDETRAEKLLEYDAVQFG